MAKIIVLESRLSRDAWLQRALEVLRDEGIRTRLLLCYLSWEPSMYPDDSKARRLKFLEMQIEMLTKK
jgi:hypothetical protein